MLLHQSCMVAISLCLPLELVEQGDDWILIQVGVGRLNVPFY